MMSYRFQIENLRFRQYKVCKGRDLNMFLRKYERKNGLWDGIMCNGALF